jgi:hypothetical protein
MASTAVLSAVTAATSGQALDSAKTSHELPFRSRSRYSCNTDFSGGPCSSTVR